MAMAALVAAGVYALYLTYGWKYIQCSVMNFAKVTEIGEGMNQ